MIELLLHADRALGMGLLDQAERLYDQALDADPRNAIAVVGLARVALERGEARAALRLAREALSIDPENAVALRLVAAMGEVVAGRGTPAAETSARADGPDPAPPAAGAAGPAGDTAPQAVVPRPAVPPPVVRPQSLTVPLSDVPHGPAPHRRGLVDRLLRRKRP